MTYPMNPPDPTAVVGRRIVAFLIDFAFVAVIFAVVGIPAFNSAAITAPADEINCPSGGSTSFDTVEDPTAESPSFCLTVGDEVQYIPESEQDGVVAMVWGSALLAGALNNVLLQGLAGGSLGKLALSLRVVRKDGRRANVGWNLLRWILFVVGALICCIGFIIDLVMVFATKGHRRVGDFAAGTFVVGKDDEGKPPQILGVTTMAPPGYPQPGPYGNPPPGYAPQQSWTPPPAGSAPTTSTPTAPTPQPAPVDPSTPAADGPTWDEARDAYIQYDPELAEWVQWDNQQNRWRSIDQ